MEWRSRISRLLGIEPPHATCLVSLGPSPARSVTDGLGEVLEDGFFLIDAGEEPSFPLAVLGLFLLAQLALRVLDGRFVVRDGVHVALHDRACDVGPGASRLPLVLVLERGDGQRGGFGAAAVVGVDFVFLVVLDAEGVGPAAIDGVHGMLFIAAAVTIFPERGAETVLLA